MCAAVPGQDWGQVAAPGGLSAHAPCGYSTGQGPWEPPPQLLSSPLQGSPGGTRPSRAGRSQRGAGECEHPGVGGGGGGTTGYTLRALGAHLGGHRWLSTIFPAQGPPGQPGYPGATGPPGLPVSTVGSLAAPASPLPPPVSPCPVPPPVLAWVPTLPGSGTPRPCRACPCPIHPLCPISAPAFPHPSLHPIHVPSVPPVPFVPHIPASPHVPAAPHIMPVPHVLPSVPPCPSMPHVLSIPHLLPYAGPPSPSLPRASKVSEATWAPPGRRGNR